MDSAAEFAKQRWRSLAACGAAALAAYKCVKCLQNGGIRRQEPRGPLAGVRVLECAVNIAGPWANTLLAELGAEVVKVECVDLPDSVRGLGTSPARGMGGCFCPIGRAKQSIVLNLKSDEGKEAFMKLAAWADVVLQNYRPGAVGRLGIAYEDVKKVNPDVIYLSSSGFGQTGPKSTMRIYDPIIQCASGFTDAQRDRETDNPHILSQVFFDKTNAMFGAQALSAALLARDRGAGGQHIEIAMIDSALMWMSMDCNYNSLWIDGGARVESVIDALRKGESAAPKAITPAAVYADPSKARFLSTGKHALFGPFRLADFPVSFSGTPLAKRPSAPMLGEHTAKILGEIGFSNKKVADMLQSGAAVSTKSLLQKMAAAPGANGPKLQRAAKAFGLVEKLQGGRTLWSDEKRRRQSVTASALRPGQPPMTGYRVLELSSLIAGPFCCAILAEQGADVIKVERVGSLDSSRRLGQQPKSGDSLGSMFMAANRNKRGIAVKEGMPGVSELMAELARWADVVVADGDDSLLPYAACKAANPAAVYLRINRGKGELAAQQESGMYFEQKTDAGQPTFVEGMICEKSTGLYCSTSVCSALFNRHRSGQGQLLEVDLLGASLHFCMIDLFMNLSWQNPKEVRAFPSIGYVYNTFFKPLKDGQFMFSCPLSNKEWKQFIDEYAPDRKDLYEGQYAEIPGRLGALEELAQEVQKISKTYDTSEFLKKSLTAELACSVAAKREDALRDPQVVHNKTVVELAKGSQKMRIARCPAVFGATPTSVRSPAPAPGEHSEEIVRDLCPSLADSLLQSGSVQKLK
eukprot:TRINITY_DN2967_c0_g1_i1.p1 TRINITY_DN2967_c0_g1~~TRINITY_DN2967_c0_g1_i1.p1  ORF type:complete len:806 (+),score=223.95 TRINITY_DN2967_c0_g1_i1:76-2493(+)